MTLHAVKYWILHFLSFFDKLQYSNDLRNSVRNFMELRHTSQMTGLFFKWLPRLISTVSCPQIALRSACRDRQYFRAACKAAFRFMKWFSEKQPWQQKDKTSRERSRFRNVLPPFPLDSETLKCGQRIFYVFHIIVFVYSSFVCQKQPLVLELPTFQLCWNISTLDICLIIVMKWTTSCGCTSYFPVDIC